MDVTADPPATDRATAVLVQGMHASGTNPLSYLAALLTQAQPLEATHQDDHPHTERIQNGAIAGINRRILQEIGSAWSNPGALFLRGKSIRGSTPLIRDAIRAHYLQTATGILRSGSSGTGIAILEDPCLCLLHDLWAAALEETGHRGRTVHVFRNPLEVAASLRDSHGLVQSRTLQMWVHYNLAALTAQARDYPLVVSYAELINPDSGLTARLTTYLNMPEPLLSEQDVQARWRPLIQPASHDIGIPSHVVDRSPLVPSLIKRLFGLLNDWASCSDEQRATELTDLSAAFEDQSLFAGNRVAVKLPEQPKPVVMRETSGPRKLLIHYHLFKNAGTSVDAILGRNFADRWVNTEFPSPNNADHQAAIRLFIRDNPHLEAISSHTLMLPVPRIDGVAVFPILFVRHPLDRIKSAYEFERKQDATTVGALIAKEQDFAGYIRRRLAVRNDRVLPQFPGGPTVDGSARGRGDRNWQRLWPPSSSSPFVGLVEAFAASAQRLQQLVEPMFPEFRSFDVRTNVTAARRDRLEERLEEIRQELGQESFRLVMEANQEDIVLYAKIRDAYGLSPVSSDFAPLESGRALNNMLPPRRTWCADYRWSQELRASASRQPHRPVWPEDGEPQQRDGSPAMKSSRSGAQPPPPRSLATPSPLLHHAAFSWSEPIPEPLPDIRLRRVLEQVDQLKRELKSERMKAAKWKHLAGRLPRRAMDTHSWMAEPSAEPRITNILMGQKRARKHTLPPLDLDQAPPEIRLLNQSAQHGSWRDPDDITPNTRRTAKEVTGFRAACALPRMLHHDGARSSITEAHIIAADLPSRFQVDAVLIGFRLPPRARAGDRA